MSHTPGPWAVDFGPATKRPFVFSMTTGEHIVPTSAEAQEADCNLIASAPELLEALKSLLRIYKHDTALQNGDNAVTVHVHNLIAKAEGY